MVVTGACDYLSMLELKLNHVSNRGPRCLVLPIWLPHTAMSTNLITVTYQWASWRLKSPASRLFSQSFVQAYIKENIRAQRYWPVWAESTDDQWFPSQRASNTENVSIWWRHHVAMLLFAYCLPETLRARFANLLAKVYEWVREYA